MDEAIVHPEKKHLSVIRGFCNFAHYFVEKPDICHYSSITYSYKNYG